MLKLQGFFPGPKLPRTEGMILGSGEKTVRDPIFLHLAKCTKCKVLENVGHSNALVDKNSGSAQGCHFRLFVAKGKRGEDRMFFLSF